MVFEFVQSCQDVQLGCTRAPLWRRHIVSVRQRDQEELRADVTWSLKHRDHWCPESQEVFLTVEEPLCGENVARSVRSEGFWAIKKEIERAREYLQSAVSQGKGEQAFQTLLQMNPLGSRQQPPMGVGLPGGPLRQPWQRGMQAQKRPLEAPEEAQRPAKRLLLTPPRAVGNVARPAAFGKGAAGRPVQLRPTP